MSKAGRNLAVGVLVAAVAGFVAGLLAAPKSGKETRQDIKRAANRTVSEAERKLKTAHGELTKLTSTAKERAAGARGRAKKEVETLAAAAERAREKVRVALSSAHEGESGDVELEQAIKDAEKSIKQIKASINKK